MTMKELLVHDLELINYSKQEAVDILVKAINDWPTRIINVRDYEAEIRNFIGQPTTEKEIARALQNIDFSINSWEAESLSQLLDIYTFYSKGLSLIEIIECIEN
jgi:hypothetical protein